jgi:cytochrome b pre-mRNA-processing protein 3
MAFAFLKRFFNRDEGRAELVPLYNAAIAAARAPHWYVEGAVPDTLDGRFDMISAVVSIILFRFEGLGEPGQIPSVMLTELFIADMDGQLREEGVGDVVVGKQVGRMLSALGGRLTAYREGLGDGGDFEAALNRNLYRSAAPSAEALAHTAQELRRLQAQLAPKSLAQLLAGDIGQ